MGPVDTQIRYINPEWRDRNVPPKIGDRESRRANTSYQDVTVRDARTDADGFGLDIAGFMLTRHQTSAAGTDEDRIKADYYPEMTELVLQHSGAARVYPNSHQIRTEDRSDFNSAYARFAHCDYNASNLEAMSHDALEKHGVKPEPGWQFAWYNTWQPFDNPVLQNALAVCDARSLPAGDIIDYRYTGYVTEENPDGGLVSAPVFNPDHRWYYFSDMATDEVLLMKQQDGRAGKAQMCPHTSFIDSSIGDHVPPRRSVEMRLLAVFES